MNLVTLLLFTLFIQNCLSQASIDTLYFGNKKFPLQRVKLNYEGYQPGIVDLPNEYKQLKNELIIPYVSFSDSLTAFGNDDDGNNYMVKIIKDKHPDKMNIYLDSFLDTIKVKTEKLKDLNIYIKSKGKRIYFSAFRILHNLNGVLSEFTAGHIVNGKLFLPFDFFNDGYYNQSWKNSTFLITDLYYQKGNATYYFDRNFIILCE